MIGERLEELRKDKGLKQSDLAKILNISASSVSAYERGISTPDDELKVQMAHFFNVSLDYLLGATDKERPLYLENDLPTEAQKEIEAFYEYIQFKYKKSPRKK